MLTQLTLAHNVSDDNIGARAMKYAVATAVFAVALLLSLAAAQAARAHDVGFQALSIPNGPDQPIKIGVWYPTDAAASAQPLGAQTQDVAPNAPVAGERLGLVVISHGTGGSFMDHYDVALALAKAGFVVAALTHPGDNFEDHSRAAHISDRPGQLKRLIDYMLGEWPGRAAIDPKRVGAFGFSAGGFTVLASIGGQPDLSKIRPHCAAHPIGFDCQLIRGTPAPAASSLPPRTFFTADPRIRAAVVAAPALGYVFGREGLAEVKVPIQLWRAGDDSVLPNPWYAEAVIDALPRPAEYFVVENADHVDFIAPCSAQLAKVAAEICQERPGFDRARFHATFDAAVVHFFKEKLG
jgi:predicted dienelactone hydrolase